MEAPEVKPREERHKVMVKARMRSGVSWHDVCILNLSTRGLGIQAPDPPARGAYVEICRGTQAIIARVVWTRGHRVGLRSQDAIFVRTMIDQAASDRPVERRQDRRAPSQRHEQSRLLARTIEFACFAVVAGGIAVTAFGAVEQALARPLSKISAALGTP